MLLGKNREATKEKEEKRIKAIIDKQLVSVPVTMNEEAQCKVIQSKGMHQRNKYRVRLQWYLQCKMTKLSTVDTTLFKNYNTLKEVNFIWLSLRGGSRSRLTDDQKVALFDNS